MPGRYFAVSRLEPGTLRLSFAGLTPEQIRGGLAILGRTVASEWENAARNYEPSPAMVSGYLAGRHCASRAGALRKRKENQPPMNADEHRYNHGVLIRVHLRLSAAR